MCDSNDYLMGTIVLCGTGWSPVKYNWFLNEYKPPQNVRLSLTMNLYKNISLNNVNCRTSG